MNGKTFIDTNVLIYAHDVDAKEKHTVANGPEPGPKNCRDSSS